jgi:hypothetical protein
MHNMDCDSLYLHWLVEQKGNLHLLILLQSTAR